MMTDPIADMITRIRNGQKSRLLSISCPYSQFKEQVLKVLKQEGYISDYTVEKISESKAEFSIDLKYTSSGEPVVQEIVKLSKPGCRKYTPASDIKRAYNGFGIIILSTSKGIMTDRDAISQKVGGELICSVF